jgi:Leucine-rich repeat (LRR) protein
MQNIPPSQPSDNSWFTNYGLDSSGEMHHKVKKIFTQFIESSGTGAIKSLKFDSNGVQIVEGKGDDLKKIIGIANSILKSGEKVSEENKLLAASAIGHILSMHHTLPYQGEPTLPFTFIEPDTKIEYICDIPLSFCLQSQILFNQIEGEARVLYLTPGVTISDVAATMNLGRDPSEQAYGLRIKDTERSHKKTVCPNSVQNFSGIAKFIDYCDCSETLRNRSIQEWKDCYDPLSSTAEIETLINDPFSHTPTGKSVVADLLSNYVSRQIYKDLGVQELNEIKGWEDYIKNCRLELSHFPETLTNSILGNLASIFPNVTSLDVSMTKVTEIPHAWKTSLIHLNVSETPMTTAPKGFIHLETFNAWKAQQLNDISGLHRLQKLKNINIAMTLVTTAPSDCTNLQIFYAFSAERLINIEGLNGLQNLEEIDISYTQVKVAPKGCIGLKIFKAEEAMKLTDISGLDALQKLEEINVSVTNITRAPKGCIHLKIFIADDATNLEDITGLNNLRILEEVKIPGTSVTTGRPSNCPSLDEYLGPDDF